MSDNPRTIVQANVRLTAGMREQLIRLAEHDGVGAYHYQSVVRDACALYLGIRATLSDRVWHQLLGNAKGQGKEPGELLGEVIERGYAEMFEELFAPPKRKATPLK